MRGRVIAVSGIDTGIGKSVATGHLAAAFIHAGRRVITQKIAQTGCIGFPEDIAEHRRLMGVGLQGEDLDGTTCPYCFAFPASPHLAAKREGREIETALLRRSTSMLQLRYELVLLEGAGGLLVPLNESLLFADYVRDAGYGLVLVTTSRLGSINHTLLSIEACMNRGIDLRAIIYNRFGETDPVITEDTRGIIVSGLKRRGLARAPLIDLDGQGLSCSEELLLQI